MRRHEKAILILAVGWFILAGFFMGVWVGAMRQLKEPKAPPIVAMAASDTIAYINNEREKERLAPLVGNFILDEVAKKKACDMRDRNYFDHQDPDGKMVWVLFKQYGYAYTYAGENLAKGSIGDNNFIITLLKSKEHRDNIFFPNYKDIGIANCGEYYVQEFGAK